MNFKWTKEKVFEESRKYTFISEFQKKSSVAYRVSVKNGWLDEMTWLKRQRKKHKIYTKKECIIISKQYQSRSELKRINYTIWDMCRKNGWLDEMTWLYNDPLVTYNSKKNNVVYVYKFIEQNSIYVGLTCNPDKRDKQHRGIDYRKINSSVYKFAKENNIDIPPMEIIESGLTKLESQELEGVYVEKY